MNNYLDNLPRPFFVLAPMFDVTDTVFRQVMSEIAAPDFTMSEFVNVDGLTSDGRPKLLPKIVYNVAEAPMIYQFWGKKPENYKTISKQVFDYSMINEANKQSNQPELNKEAQAKIIGVDINMGCPDKAVLKNGCCSALIKDHVLADEIIESTREGIDGRGTLSVKTRIGFSSFDRDWLEFLFSKKLNMLSIHLRTVREMSKVPAHFELLEEIVKMRDSLAPDTLLVANGDITDRKHGQQLHKKYGMEGIMIGRGIFHNPYAFSEDSPWEHMQPNQRIDLYKRHVQLYLNTWQNNEYPVITLNKFCKIYVSGFDGAKELREKLMSCRDAKQLLERLEELA